MIVLPKVIDELFSDEHIDAIIYKMTIDDCIDLMIVTSEALKQCSAQNYDSMDFTTAVEFSDTLQDSFTCGIDELDGFMNTVLTVDDWLTLSVFAVDVYRATLQSEAWKTQAKEEGI